MRSGDKGLAGLRNISKESRPTGGRLAILFLGFVLHLAAPVAHAGRGEGSVGYLRLAPEKTPEDSAVVAWLSSNLKSGDRAFDLASLDLGDGLPGLEGIGVLWIHIPDSADYARWRPRLVALRPLKSWYENGGRFLFTGLAAMIPHAIGIEGAAPSIEGIDVGNDWLFDQKGFQGYRPDIASPGGGHPVFAGLFGGVFTWDAEANHRLWLAGYFGDSRPSAGRVIGVEKAYITISAGRKLLIEYGNGKGRGLSAGGFVFFRETNHRRDNLARFVENALEYLAGNAAPESDRYAWPPSDDTPVRVDIPRPLPDSIRAGRPGGEASWGRHRHGLSSGRDGTGLSIARDSATSNFYDVAGRRAVAMGKEHGGIDEIWTHPFRLLRDYRAGIISGDSVLWLDALPARLEIRPEAVTRTYAAPSWTLKERTFASIDDPSCIVRYEYDGAPGQRLVVMFRSDLRLMWPYDAPATGGLRYGYDSTTGTLMVSDGPGRSWGLFGSDAAPSASLAGQFDSVWWGHGEFAGRTTDAGQVYHAAAYDLGGVAGRELTFAFTGETGDGPAWREHRRALDLPAAEFQAVVDRYDDLLSESVTIDSPDDEFDDLFKWAIVGTDRFIVNTPGVGEGLLAGYSTTARGWDGAQKISGRPGYAWYFGRDAAWSGFAVDDYGDFRTVRAELELMQRYQDLSGKIFHEISTSGSVHYDASDATPLYVLLAAHYLRASGDTAFIRSSWAHIRMALDYLYTTDTDGDGLIENTNQGHGWVEGGALYPVHTEFYLAGAWGKALLDASYIASTLGMTAPADRYGEDARKVQEILNRDFWNPTTKFFNLGKMADGTYNAEPTVLPATVMYHGLLDDEKVRPVLEQYAGSGFTSDWGVRIVSSASSLFNPQGYHYGSVWPLFTGWTALAEYEYGNSTQGFTHILNNMYIKNHWALGFVEEVMNGAVYKPSGVCPHQCWSETNILHPAINGMIGWKPDAPSHSAGLRPRFPIHWDSVEVRNLRVGTASIDVAMERDSGKTVWRFSTGATERSGGPLRLSFAPELPDGMRISKILFEGKELPVPTGSMRGLIDPPVRIEIPADAGGARVNTLVVEHTGGIGVVPAMPRPEPGDSSTGHRIISEEMRDGAYEIKVEGRAGTSAEIEVRTFDRGIGRVENTAIIGEGKKGRYRLRVEFPQAATPYVTVTVKARTD
jgi:hypothetical protein